LKTNASDDSEQSPVEFPAIALLISGGHTELVEISEWGKYKILGATKDDAVGEAFDKVARMLGLPYPGGPQISMLAEDARKNGLQKKCQLPRPMIHSGDFDFSFSGLKTAVLYYIKKLPELTDEDKKDIAREFEDAVVDVLSIKTASVLGTTPAKTLILAGGVIANKMIRQKFENFSQKYPGLSVWFPTNSLSTDNSVMIAAAAYIGEMLGRNHTDELEIRAKGNLSIEE
jgi:N6-L-threonylcarbamoyladenine synthase